MKWITGIISSKPGIGAGITSGSFGWGMFIKMGYTPEFHQMINEFLQSAAFLMTLVVGLLTVISWVKKNREKK